MAEKRYNEQYLYMGKMVKIKLEYNYMDTIINRIPCNERKFRILKKIKGEGIKAVYQDFFTKEKYHHWTKSSNFGDGKTAFIEVHSLYEIRHDFQEKPYYFTAALLQELENIYNGTDKVSLLKNKIKELIMRVSTLPDDEFKDSTIREVFNIMTILANNPKTNELKSDQLLEDINKINEEIDGKSLERTNNI